MATASAFKLTCPSCEESVPIRDPKLIGKKIDCPTCKYRFVVEQPNGAAKTNGAAAKGTTDAAPKNRLKKSPAKAAGEIEKKSRVKGKSAPPRKSVPGLEDMEKDWQDEAESDAKGKKKKKKKKSGGFSLDFKKDKLKLGLGLAGVCIVLLAIAGVAIMMFGGGGNNPLRPGPGFHPNPGGPGNKYSKKTKTKVPYNNKGGVDPVLAAAKAAFTNLLPTDTQHVVHLHVDEFRNSPTGAAAFNKRGMDNKETEARLGFSPNDVDQILHAENYSNGWAFNAIHLTRAFNEPKLIAALALKDVEPIEKQKYYAITKNNLWLEEFGRLTLAARQALLLSKQRNADERVLYARLHNPQTLIIANRLPMQEFLKVKGAFPLQDEIEKPKFPIRPQDPGQDIPPDQLPEGPGAQLPAGGARLGVGPARINLISFLDAPAEFTQSGFGRQNPPEIPGQKNRRKNTSGGFPGGNATNPAQKYSQPGRRRGGFPGTSPAPGQTEQYGGNPFARPFIGPPTYRTLPRPLREMMRRLEELPPNSKTKILFSSATDMAKARIHIADPLFSDYIIWRLRLMWDVTRLLTETKERIQILGVGVRQREEQKYQLKNVLVCADKRQARNLSDLLQDESASQVKQFFKTVFGHDITIPSDKPAKKTTIPGGAPDGGMPGGMPEGAEGGMEPGVVPPEAGGAVGAGGEQAGGTSGYQRNRPGGGYPGRGSGYPQGKYGNQEIEEDVKESRIVVKHADRDVTFDFDLVLNKDDFRQFRHVFALVTDGLINQLKLAHQDFPRLKLGAALKTLGQQGLSERDIPSEHYPFGAFPRYGTTRRAAQDPLARVSWMAGLLPYLGQQRVFDSINFDRSWKDPTNWLAARTIVPEFIDPIYPPHLRTVQYPGVPFPSGATHYVGVAGVGLNAAAYKANDPAVIGKIGVFGYDRTTSLAQIKQGRGTSNTIVMIQVPADGAAGINPWMAGGGSTVRGVPVKNSLAPFIGNHGRYGRGAFVVMADGSVRFLPAPEKISDFDRVFQAMCTINGPAPEGVDLNMVGKRIERPRPAPPKEEKKVKKAAKTKPKASGKKKTQPKIAEPKNKKEPNAGANTKKGKKQAALFRRGRDQTPRAMLSRLNFSGFRHFDDCRESHAGVSDRLPLT